jgi:hypothetical protein
MFVYLSCRELDLGEARAPPHSDQDHASQIKEQARICKEAMQANNLLSLMHVQGTHRFATRSSFSRTTSKQRPCIRTTAPTSKPIPLCVGNNGHQQSASQDQFERALQRAADDAQELARLCSPGVRFPAWVSPAG